MKISIYRPMEQPTPLEHNVMYVVLRSDGASKQFHQMTTPAREDNFTWGYGNHHSSAAQILIPVDPWTAIKTGMVTFEELQLPEGARALLNIIK